MKKRKWLSDIIINLSINEMGFYFIIKLKGDISIQIVLNPIICLSWLKHKQENTDNKGELLRVKPSINFYGESSCYSSRYWQHSSLIKYTYTKQVKYMPILKKAASLNSYFMEYQLRSFSYFLMVLLITYLIKNVLNITLMILNIQHKNKD